MNMKDYLALHLYTSSSKGTCSVFHNHVIRSAFNNEHNSYPKISAIRPIACSGVVLFTSVDRRYI